MKSEILSDAEITFSHKGEIILNIDVPKIAQQRNYLLEKGIAVNDITVVIRMPRNTHIFGIPVEFITEI